MTIKIDPTTPKEFHEMDIDDMPQAVLDEWWEQPYIQTRGESFAVLCLDGGAWDRPTVKGFFDTKQQAINYITQKGN